MRKKVYQKISNLKSYFSKGIFIVDGIYWCEKKFFYEVLIYLMRFHFVTLIFTFPVVLSTEKNGSCNIFLGRNDSLGKVA